MPPAAAGAPLLRVEDLTVEIRGYRVLEGVTLELRGPGLVQVLGPNGAGKTTLLRAILGLVKPLHGHVVINGVEVTGDPAAAGRVTGYVPQLDAAEKHFPLTAWELVLYECLARCQKWPRLGASPEAAKKAEAALEAVGLPREAWGRRLDRLSGGQRQRALIARALVHNPPVLLMDEPLSAIDPAGRAEIAELIAGLAREKLVVVTSHDPMLLLEHTNEIILMHGGRVIARGEPPRVLSHEVLEKVYGAAALHVEKHIHIADSH